MKAEKAVMNSFLFKKNWGTNCTDIFKINSNLGKWNYKYG